MNMRKVKNWNVVVQNVIVNYNMEDIYNLDKQYLLIIVYQLKQLCYQADDPSVKRRQKMCMNVAGQFEKPLITEHENNFSAFLLLILKL